MGSQNEESCYRVKRSMKIPARYLVIFFVCSLLSTLESSSSDRRTSSRGVERTQDGAFINAYPPSSPVPSLRIHLDSLDLLSDVCPSSGECRRTESVEWDELRIEPDPTDMSRRACRGEACITWLGQAGFLVRMNETALLLDPVLDEFDFPLDMLTSLRRISSPPVPASSLPRVDGVLISHDHYDHLNWRTLDVLPGGRATPHLVPRGVQSLFPARYEDVRGMGWFTSEEIAGVTVHFVPAHHRSQRFFRQRTTLWGGFVIESSTRRIYFAGDTAYSAIFENIRERLGPMDICLLPIITYRHGVWHMSPEEALMVAKVMECRVVVPWGWGTFLLSPEHVYEPVRRLQKALGLIDIESSILLLKQGETATLKEDDPLPTQRMNWF